MAKQSISDLVRTLAQPIADEVGCELVDVEFVKEGGSWFLRIYIDKTGGVTLDDCEKVSKPLNDRIDELDPIPNAYYLEVSSPGLERPLKTPRDFEKALGSHVEIRLFKAIDGVKRFDGILKSFDDNSVTLTIGSETAKVFPKEQIAKVKKVIDF